MTDVKAKPAIRNDAPHSDLRDFLERIEAIGELKHIKGAHWDLEMGCLSELIHHGSADQPPALIFEDIPGYEGFRCVAGLTNSSQRLAVALGFPLSKHPLDIVECYRNRMKVHEPIPPVQVDPKTAPIFENVISGDDIDVLKFPVPKLHELDGGRYIGTDDLVIMHDPEDDWVNIDPTNTFHVLWAISTRSNPADDIDFIRRAWSGPLDPLVKDGLNMNSRGLIDACRPFERLDTFPPVARASDELKEKMRKKFSHVLK